jgi:hypothetical protein
MANVDRKIPRRGVTVMEKSFKDVCWSVAEAKKDEEIAIIAELILREV